MAFVDSTSTPLCRADDLREAEAADEGALLLRHAMRLRGEPSADVRRSALDVLSRHLAPESRTPDEPRRQDGPPALAAYP